MLFRSSVHPVCFAHIYIHSRDFRFSSLDYGFVSGFAVKVSLRQTTDWEVTLAFLNSNRLRTLLCDR
jgi:hypothetical protein